MKYNMIREWYSLPKLPTNSEETANKLRCLRDLETVYDRYGQKRRGFYDPKGPSKRRKRLLKMFYAYHRMEAV